MSSYDRTLLQAVARAHGIHTYVDLGHHLKVAPVTAWRLWHGKSAPSAPIAAKVQEHLGLTLPQLMQPTTEDAA